MGYFLRIPVAVVGLLLLRGFLYPRGWGHRSLGSVLLAVIGAALTVPLASYSRNGLVIVLVAAPVVLFPYRRLAIAYMKARTRTGLRQLAERWGTELREDPESGRWEVVREEDGQRAWVGNVLTRQGSIHPGVKRVKIGYMLAFVIELKQKPPFHCSLMLGWDKPRYFEREWRATHVIQGEYLSLAFGELGLESDRGRPTGGVVAALFPYDDLPEIASRGFTAIGTQPERFARVFDGDTLAEFLRLARRTYPYELNVTPSSVNIYTTYCDAEVQRSNIEFLEKLAARVESTR
ncbi:MAG: hypothetical protein JSV41_10355 [Gemmatimonadota bacterium]|nr:MAG: hypothetical protein JSV41_10355 [Gemmatimonadota bacterium]